jgi:hypothetical protein
MNKLNLILHTGARAVQREQLANVITPARTATWVPIAHEQLLAGVVGALQANHMAVVNESHGLTRDGSRYFGLLQVRNGCNADDFSLVVGVRNSHDKTFPAGLVVGASVFVCDNLSFSGEIKLARKHTVYINRDLPQLINRAMGALQDHRGKQDQRFLTYKQTEFSDAQAHDLIVRAVDARVCPVTQIPHVVKEWRAPRHLEFRANGKTAWRLFNAFSECLKGNLDYLPRRTQALHGLMDVACRIDGAPVLATIERPASAQLVPTQTPVVAAITAELIEVTDRIPRPEHALPALHV